MSRCSLLTRNGPSHRLGLPLWPGDRRHSSELGLCAVKKTQEGVRPAAGDETRPSKAWGTNSSRDGPISQLLLNLLAAVAWMKVENLNLLSPHPHSAGKPSLGENRRRFLALLWM